MLMPYFTRWILIVLAFPLSNAFSQELWTLDECISYANENNIQLKQKDLSIDLAENDLLQSKMELLPNAGLGASQTYRFGRSVDPLTYEFTTENSKGSSFYGSTGVDLFKGFRTINTIRRDRLNLDMMLEAYKKAKNDLALNITRYYLQILFNKELREIAVEQVNVTELQVSKTERLVEAGELPKGDLLEIQALLAGEELNLVNANNQLKLSLLDLAQLLDINDVGNFDIVQPAFSNFVVEDIISDADEVYQSALMLMPQVKGAELNVKLFEKELAISKGWRSPSLSMNAAWGSGYSDRILDFQSGKIMPFRDQLEFASTTSLGLNLSVPIFSNLSALTDIKNKKIALLNVNYELEAVKNQLRKEIQQAAADAGAALEKYYATEKNLTSLQEAFRYTENKFSAGMLTSLDYNIAKKNLTKAQSDLLQAKYNYIFNLKILDFYRGLPVSFRQD